jgi:hypothetical protein
MGGRFHAKISEVSLATRDSARGYGWRNWSSVLAAMVALFVLPSAASSQTWCDANGNVVTSSSFNTFFAQPTNASCNDRWMSELSAAAQQRPLWQMAIPPHTTRLRIGIDGLCVRLYR